MARSPSGPRLCRNHRMSGLQGTAAVIDRQIQQSCSWPVLHRWLRELDGMKPVRIQRRRTKGWKMPSNTVYVGRGSKWGNPHRIGVSLTSNGDGTYRRMTAIDAVDRYRNEY